MTEPCTNPACTGHLEPLPDSLTAGLTMWNEHFGAQIRVETEILIDDTGQPVFTDGLPVLGGRAGALYLAFKPDAPRSTEDGEPYRLDRDAARALRDLLNIATARGAL